MRYMKPLLHNSIKLLPTLLLGHWFLLLKGPPVISGQLDFLQVLSYQLESTFYW